jgi:hypothetical protein
MPTSNEQAVHTGTVSRPLSGRPSWPAALLPLACAVAGSTLALHYPLSGFLATLLFALTAVAAWLRPDAWLVLLPALLPIMGFAPWTGWITFEELDLLVLAVAAGGYARRAWRTPADPASRPNRTQSGSNAAALIGLTIAMFAASTLLAMARGFADAGGFSFGWFQGYREPMNSVRLAKPFFAALLLWPLWAAASRDDPERASTQLSLGMMLGLLAVSVAALWERLAFTALLNFSSDYRTTSLFWEMHVGGAAFDGFLALCMPFAVREMLVSKSKARWLLAAAVTALGAYACITTFSRGVYMAVPVGLAVMIGLHVLQRRRHAPAPTLDTRPATALRLALMAGFGLAAAWMFPTSGYRGIVALSGAFAVLVQLGAALRDTGRTEQAAATSHGVVLALLAGGLNWLLPKGPYVAYAFSLAFALCMLAWHRRTGKASAAMLALAGYLWVLTGVALVSLHWGGEDALERALPVLALLLAAPFVRSGRRATIWPDDLRWQGNTLGLALAAGALVAAFGGGAYMGGRFSSTGTDLAGRMQHWQRSLSMFDGAGEWLLGKGLGRYPESYAIAAPENMRPGDYRLRGEGGGRHLLLTGGAQVNTEVGAAAASGDMLRLSQRVRVPQGPVQLELDVRAAVPTTLVVGVCAKHLLYGESCIGHQVGVKPALQQWQRLQLPLQGDNPSRGDWYAPRLLMFSIGIDNPGGRVEIDRLELSDGTGASMLANGDFEGELAHWFFTSDRSHLPWHAKNMALHVLFDQGLLGLALLATLWLGAVWRLSLGGARDHTLAPTMAGAIVGFAAVGLFDSLLDVPRVAFVFYSLLLIGLTFRVSVVPDAARARHRSRSAPADS